MFYDSCLHCSQKEKLQQAEKLQASVVSPPSSEDEMIITTPRASPVEPMSGILIATNFIVYKLDSDDSDNDEFFDAEDFPEGSPKGQSFLREVNTQLDGLRYHLKINACINNKSQKFGRNHSTTNLGIRIDSHANSRPRTLWSKPSLFTSNSHFSTDIDNNDFIRTHSAAIFNDWTTCQEKEPKSTKEQKNERKRFSKRLTI